MRIFQPVLATNAAVGILLGAILAAVLGGAVAGLLVGVIHLIAPSQLDTVLTALGGLSLHSPWRDTLGILFIAHGIALKTQFNAHAFLEVTTSKATLSGLLVIPACCLTLGGYVAASTDFSNRALHSLWRGAAIALPYAMLLLLFIPTINGSVPFPGATIPDESISVTTDGTSLFFFSLLWGVLFGLLGASLKLGSRRWRQMLSVALRFNRFPQIGATVAGAGAAIGLGLALSLLCLYSFLAYASFSTPIVKQYLLVSDDWQSKAAWSLSRAPLYAANLFMYSFNAPFQLATNRGDNALCPFNPGGSPSEFAPCETTLSMFGGSPHLPPWTFAFLSIAVLSLFLGGRVSASIGRAQRAGPGLLQGAAIALPFTLLMLLLAALTNDFVQDTFTSTSVTTITFSQGVSPLNVLPWAFFSSVLLGALGGLYQASSFKQGMSTFLRVLSAPLRWLGAPATWLGERLRGCSGGTRPTTALVLLYNALFWALVLLVVMGVASVYLIEQALAIALHTNELIRDILGTLLVALPGLLLLSAGAAALAEHRLPSWEQPFLAPVSQPGFQSSPQPGMPAPYYPGQPGIPVLPQAAPLPIPPVLPPPPATSWRSRIMLIVILVLVLALSLGGALAMNVTAQAGLSRAYPRPQVSVIVVSTEPFHTNEAVNFSVSGHGRDLSYNWDFGDGSNDDSGQSVSHAYSDLGSFTVTVTATDPIGQRSSATTSVTVQPQIPVASFTTSPGFAFDVQFDASASTADPSLTITNYHWDFGDGSTDDTSLSFDNHVYSGSGPYTVTLTVTDSSNHTSQPSSQAVSPQQ